MLRLAKQCVRMLRHPRQTAARFGLGLTRIPVERLLRSGESGIPANQYARLIGRPLRASERVIDGPQVAFLRRYAEIGRSILEPDALRQTEYFRNAVECIDFTGHYFPRAKRPDDVVEVAAAFLDAFDGRRPALHAADEAHNAPGDPIVVRAVKHSHCYELVHGNHRVASAVVRGATAINALVLRERVTTPAQDLLMDVLWQGGRRELYQPVALPEVAEWDLVRACTDRWEMMRAFLADQGVTGGRALDVGSSYGWFVGEMMKAGFEAHGVERDPFAIAIGTEIYGLPAERFTRSDVAGFLERAAEFDVVSCLSVAHHFALGKEAISVGELLARLGRATRRVLLFDTGEQHERWFQRSLPEWTPEFIRRQLLEHTGLGRVVPLGQDRDGRGRFHGNYGRTLFACMRT